MKGYMGKILKVDLSSKVISTIPTKKYERYGGGHGIGSAVFWDEIDKDFLAGSDGNSCFDPKNVVTVMTSPLAGTLVPAGGGRCEVQGLGAQGYPISWFVRSNFGGRFSSMLKYAGWDGVVITGKADKPVWINIVNDDVKIEDATGVWGLNTWEAQEEIWRRVTGTGNHDDWVNLDSKQSGVRSTQHPAVLAAGPAGENLARSGCLVHDHGNGAGQGGFGGVFGSKNLKAVSVLGNQSVEIADPAGLLSARQWLLDRTFNVDDPLREPASPTLNSYGILSRSPGHISFKAANVAGEPNRPQGCTSCFINCRRITESGTRNGSQCVEFFTITAPDDAVTAYATDQLQKLGINAYEVRLHSYFRDLFKAGILGPGKQIECDVPWDKYMTKGWVDAYLNGVAYRDTPFGNDLAEGMVRAAKKWGRYDEDTTSGVLNWAYWGFQDHYDPRAEVTWGYGSILGDREINEHDMGKDTHWHPTIMDGAGEEPMVSAKRLSEIYAEKMVPYNDPMMMDYSPEGRYSEGMVKAVAWHRRYSRFWKQSIGYCDWAYTNLVNPNVPDYAGVTPEAEPKFYNAVTGDSITFLEGQERGAANWNLDRAIWILQGRHRDQEVYPNYIYEVPIPKTYWLTAYENGKWEYKDCKGYVLDRAKMENWKTMYYKFEGWDPSSGWPTRDTLESYDLGFVADELQERGKLGG